jgi:hypothetical protein
MSVDVTEEDDVSMLKKKKRERERTRKRGNEKWRNKSEPEVSDGGRGRIAGDGEMM